MSKNDSGDRFKIVYQQGVMNRCRIIVDRETGVNYLFACDGNAGGLTILLDSEGKPVITPIEQRY